MSIIFVILKAANKQLKMGENIENEILDSIQNATYEFSDHSASTNEKTKMENLQLSKSQINQIQEVVYKQLQFKLSNRLSDIKDYIMH